MERWRVWAWKSTGKEMKEGGEGVKGRGEAEEARNVG